MVKNGLDLAQVTDAIAKARKTYEKVNIPLDPDLTFLPFVGNSYFLPIFTLVTSACIVCLIGAVVILSLKLRKTNILIKAGYVAAASHLPGIKANLLTKSTTTSLPSSTPHSPTWVSHDHEHYLTLAMIVLFIFALYKLTKYAYKKLRTKCPSISKAIDNYSGLLNQADYTSHLVLFITNNQIHVALSLTEVPCATPLLGNAVRPQVTNLQYFKGKGAAKLTWDGPLQYEIDGQTVHVLLPNTINVPFQTPKSLIKNEVYGKGFQNLLYSTNQFP